MCLEEESRKEPSGALYVWRCDQLVGLEPPPAGAQVEALAILTVEADPRERPPSVPAFELHPDAGQASFLLAQTAGGFCVVDKVLDWDWDRLGTIYDSFTTQWRALTSEFELTLRAQHESRLELDEEELANDEPDLTYQLCRTTQYSVAAGKFKQLAKTSAEGPCAAR
ncbi:MAG: hypothetical protein JWN48_4866 [Myxococcaceae bacterium]|nr:hypothetical protein [Myxococcaceae bacterium]